MRSPHFLRDRVPPLATPRGIGDNLGRADSQTWNHGRVRPEVVAHRGASEHAPEHTLAAYVQAIVDGADALECDVRLTADGVLVCVHDRTVDRTSNGSGVVSTLELADLAELDFGAWRSHAGTDESEAIGRQRGPNRNLHDHEAPDRVDRSSVLTLERLLELVVDTERDIELAIETKHPTRYSGLVERTLIETLDRFGLGHPRVGTISPIRVMSFSQQAVRRISVLAPSIPTVFLMERVPLRMRDGSLPTHTRIAGPAIEIVRAHPHYVSRVHDAGGAVHVWTVNADEDIELCVELDVDAIITNRPGHVLERLKTLVSV